MPDGAIASSLDSQTIPEPSADERTNNTLVVERTNNTLVVAVYMVGHATDDFLGPRDYKISIWSDQVNFIVGLIFISGGISTIFYYSESLQIVA